MREAFKRAAEKNPNPEITGMLRTAEYSQRRERRLEKLGGRFEYIGKEWLNHMMKSYVSISMRKLKEEWKELPPLLANIEESERGELIGRLAKGLMLSENFNSSNRALATLEILKNSSWELWKIFSTKRFSQASSVFFGAISDISGYSKEQRTSFIEFMNKREDLTELVSLPQVFPAVAEWLVQSRNDSQSSRLS